jgi:hypothetical protein
MVNIDFFYIKKNQSVVNEFLGIAVESIYNKAAAYCPIYDKGTDRQQVTLRNFHLSNRARVDSTKTHNPINATNKKDARKVANPAIKPIMGGPIKKPAKPMVETAASATPGDMVLDFPAALYIIGTTEDTPIPTSIKPAIAV